jgi:hypothetical protein
MQNGNSSKIVSPSLIFNDGIPEQFGNEVFSGLTAEFNTKGEPIKLNLCGDSFESNLATSLLFECREYPEDSIIGYELVNKRGHALRVDKEVSVIQLGFALNELVNSIEKTSRSKLKV